MMAMEATIFTGWIYDHLVPHAEKGRLLILLCCELLLQRSGRTTRSMPAR